ncbi:hypothetical protein N7450_008162 [Penicillium hetheringtonii]|uniref:Amidohydrolase-related domain-containing protein n=1 Tax=Penicillium hetheringtonii TaxID=911720 RepID=A0AAD6DFI6_9EURO|nr:hypothetical protein N7450_008162 [Penicillium hetheringtonii]
MDDIICDNMWDTHIHCLDPVRYPFKTTRLYTPLPAPLEELVKNSIAKNIVLVQASVEDGHSALIGHLDRIRTEYPEIFVRGIISLNEDWDTLTNAKSDTLHELGVRYVRIHGTLGSDFNDISDLKNTIKTFACSYAAQRLGWGISAQLPFTTWLLLKSFLCEDPGALQLPVIIDHVGCSSPELIESPNFEDFITLLQRRNTHVKISSLYRRDKSISKMKAIIQKLATCAPASLLWGSDWPHVNSSYQGNDAPPIPEAVDAKKELLTIQSWLSEEQFTAMLVDNPKRAFVN